PNFDFSEALEGVRSLGAALDDRGFVLVAARAWAQCWVFIGSAAARDCSPPESGTSIGALIKVRTWSAAGPSAPGWSIGGLFWSYKGMRPMLGLQWFRGCKGLQPSKN